MPLEVEAVYEDGVLKFDRPLPLDEHGRVMVEIKPKISRVVQSYGLIGWTGDPEAVRRIAEDDEFGVLESTTRRDP